MDAKNMKIYKYAEVEQRAASVLPTADYTILLGASIYSFNYCLAYIIELLSSQIHPKLDWYTLTDKTAGMICGDVEDYLDNKDNINPKLHVVYKNLCNRRNRIIHSFPVTGDHGVEQRLQTKTRANNQSAITKEYMKDFIHDVTDFRNRLGKIILP